MNSVRPIEGPQEHNTPWQAGTLVVVASIAAAKLALHLATAGRYGYFRDELYYIACSRHLDWGYVDQPPLIALVTWLELHLGGTSLHSLRFLPALAGVALVFLTAVLAREMGANRFGTWFAALAAACVGIYFVMNYLLTMNAFEPLFWMGCACLLVRIINTGNQKLWLWFGLLAGLGLQNKYSMGIFVSAMILGVLFTPERRAFAQRWIWIGGGIALLVFLPNLLWNIHHQWPFVELMRNIKASGRDVELGPLRYFVEQIFLVNPILFPVWLAGLLSLFVGKELRRYRALAWAYVFSLGVMIVMKGKNYYVAPAYPMLLGAGAIVIERLTARLRGTWPRPVMVTVVLIVTALLLPLGVPVLTAENFLRYEAKLPFPLPVSEKGHAGAAMPQYYSDQFGWEEMTAAVARAYGNLTPEERTQACIGASNYGEAGAIDFFGSRYGLPNAISGHQNYFLWGPRNCTGQVLILLGDRPEKWNGRCERVEVAAQLYHPYAIRFENKPVIVCHGLKADLHKMWPSVKNWD
jgi:hypothetical protein